MIQQLNPPLPIRTPKGPALAHFLIDYGPESNLFWVCFINSTGECWTFANPDIRADKNITLGRDYISPFYNPDDVKFPSNFEELIKPPALKDPSLEKITCTGCGLQHLVKLEDAADWECPRCYGSTIDRKISNDYECNKCQSRHWVTDQMSGTWKCAKCFNQK